MSLTLIICAWLFLPGLALWAAIQFYVPAFLHRYRRPAAGGAADELLERRVSRQDPIGPSIARSRRSA